jgi:lysophospholipase L1-like esterase
LIAEGAAYGLFRLTQPYRSLSEFHQKRLANELDPYRIIRLNPNHEYHGVKHNRQGFRRSSDVSREKPDNTIRIFLMGGSAAYGVNAPPPFPDHWVSNEETLDVHLERILKQAYPAVNFEVINAAVTGYGVHQHLIYLNQVILDYDPDMVLFLDGYNDHYYASDDYSQWEFRHLNVDEFYKPTFLNALNKFFEFGAQHSYAVAGIYSRINHLLNRGLTPTRLGKTFTEDNEALDSELAELYRRTAKRTWARIDSQNVRLLQEHGIQAVVMLQPQLLFRQSKPMALSENEIREIVIKYREEGHVEYLNFVKPLAIEIIQQTLEGTDALFIDLTDPFPDMKEQAYIDYCHLNAAGMQALAEYIYPRLKPVLAPVLEPYGIEVQVNRRERGRALAKSNQIVN